MEFIRANLPEKEIEICLDLFSKEEAKTRLLDYIKGVIDDSERQFNYLKNSIQSCNPIKINPLLDDECIKTWVDEWSKIQSNFVIHSSENFKNGYWITTNVKKRVYKGITKVILTPQIETK